MSIIGEIIIAILYNYANMFGLYGMFFFIEISKLIGLL